jgi:hypothetical protein
MWAVVAVVAQTGLDQLGAMPLPAILLPFVPVIAALLGLLLKHARERSVSEDEVIDRMNAGAPLALSEPPTAQERHERTERVRDTTL